MMQYFQFFYLHVCVFVSGHENATASKRSQDNLPESVLSFHHMGSGDQTQVVRFGAKAPLSAEPAHLPAQYSYSYF